MESAVSVAPIAPPASPRAAAPAAPAPAAAAQSFTPQRIKRKAYQRAQKPPTQRTPSTILMLYLNKAKKL